MSTNSQKVIVVNPLTANIQQWMFDKSEVENRSAVEIIQTLHDSGELPGNLQEWKMSYQGKHLNEYSPLNQQVDFNEMETRLHVQPIVAGARTVFEAGKSTP
jgi:hypothetical protein